jgi:hypothetical protein
VPLADIGAEFLFQVISDRAEGRPSSIFRMDNRVSESAALQGAAGPDHGSSPHYRHRNRILPLPAHVGKKQKAL